MSEDDGALAVAEVDRFGDLLGHDARGTTARLEAVRFDMLEPLLADSGGRVVAAAGGRWVLAFDEASAAVAAAQFFQAGMVLREAPLLAEDRLRFRLAIAAGADEDLAATLAAQAAPGGVLIAGAVYRQLSADEARAFHAAEAADSYATADGEAPIPQPAVQPRRRLSNSSIGWAIMLALLLVLAIATYF